MNERKLREILLELEELAAEIESRKEELVRGSTTEFIKNFTSISKSLSYVSDIEKSMENKAAHLLYKREETIKKLRKENLQIVKKSV